MALGSQEQGTPPADGHSDLAPSRLDNGSGKIQCPQWHPVGPHRPQQPQAELCALTLETGTRTKTQDGTCSRRQILYQALSSLQGNLSLTWSRWRDGAQGSPGTNLPPNLWPHLWDLKAASITSLPLRKGEETGRRMEGLPMEDRTHPLGLLSSSIQHASRRVPGPMVKRSPETQATPHLWDCTLWAPGPYSQNILSSP